MAFIGNRSVFHKSPSRYLNGNAAAGGGQASMRSNFNKHGMQRNAFEQFDAKSAIPYGHLSPSAWVLPKRAGGISSHNVTLLTASTSGLAVGGITADAPASFAFTVEPAAGQLISSGIGSASMTFTVANLLLTASLNGVGSSAFTITTNTPLLGAEASAIGDAVLSFTASLTPFAIGSMSGSTVDNSVLTVDAIAAGVLAAALTSPIAADIKKVNSYTVDGNGQTGTEWGPA
jgi:hypothetical protein